MIRLPFVGGSHESLPVSASQAVNCFPELGQDVNPVQRSVPGTSVFCDLGEPIRGMHYAFGRLYAVAGERFYSVSVAGVGTSLGVVGTSSAPVSMAHNIFELLTVSGGKGYVVQAATNAFSEITDTDFPVTRKCEFLDGYGILLEAGTGRFRFTAIDDFESINGVDFATAEGSPDKLVSVVVDHRELLLFGERTIEVWYNDGSSPFSRAPSGFVERGCTGTFSPAKVDNTVFWLGDDKIVYRLEQRTPIRISNHGVEQAIARTSVEPVSLAYTQGGHAFYQLTFPGELTIVYDAATQRWHTRQTQGRDDCVYQHHAFAYGKHLVGGADGKIYELNPNLYQHAGDELPRSRTIGPLRTEGFQSMHSLTFMLAPGVTSHIATSPKVFLDISDDGGRTFNQRMEAFAGKQGDYLRQVDFFGLGGYYDNQRVLKLSMTDNAEFTIVDAYAEVS